MHNFTIEQKRTLCELLNGMDKAIQLDDTELFYELNNNYHACLEKFLENKSKDLLEFGKIGQYDLVSNAYANAFMFIDSRMFDKAKKELEKARTLKNRYFFY